MTRFGQAADFLPQVARGLSMETMNGGPFFSGKPGGNGKNTVSLAKATNGGTLHAFAIQARGPVTAA
jgi:hypothetical protein